MESSLLPMIDNVRGDKAIVRLDCHMHFQKTGFIVFFYFISPGRLSLPGRLRSPSFRTSPSPCKSCVRRAQTPLGAAVHMQRVCCACSVEAFLTDIRLVGFSGDVGL